MAKGAFMETMKTGLNLPLSNVTYDNEHKSVFIPLFTLALVGNDKSVISCQAYTYWECDLSGSHPHD